MSERLCALISGLGASNGLAPTRAQMVEQLQARRSAAYTPYFASSAGSESYGMPFNPLHVAMPTLANGRRNSGRGDVPTAEVLLADVIAAALADAGLEADVLRGKRVRMYIAGQGIQADFMGFAAFMQRNDREDLLFNPAIKDLHCSTHLEEGLARVLMKRYGLAFPPVSLTTASCSSLSALQLACKAIESGSLDLALVVSWQQVSLYNLVFMSGLNSLAREVAQPFSAGTEGVMLGAGVAAAVLESPAHLRAREGRGQLRVAGLAMAQGSGSGRGGQSFSPDFRAIAKTIEEALAKAGVQAAQIGCVFAHGNGIRGSDQAELMALRKVWGEQGIPVVSYKAQLGYQVAVSGLTDLAILEDAMRQRRLLGFAANAELDTASGVHLHAAAEPLVLDSPWILKLSLGIEGSIAACTLEQAA